MKYEPPTIDFLFCIMITRSFFQVLAIICFFLFARNVHEPIKSENYSTVFCIPAYPKTSQTASSMYSNHLASASASRRKRDGWTWRSGGRGMESARTSAARIQSEGQDTGLLMMMEDVDVVPSWCSAPARFSVSRIRPQGPTLVRH